MLSITVQGPEQQEQVKHQAGPLELGARAERQVPRLRLADPYASRDQLAIEELTDGRLRVVNLSQSKSVQLPDGSTLATGAETALKLPATLQVGMTAVIVERESTPEIDCLLTVTPQRRGPRLREIARPAASPEHLTAWLEAVIALQQSSATLPELYQEAARTLVELVGLDLGLVLLQREGQWSIAAAHTVDDRISPRFSRTLVQHVVANRRTYYQDLNKLAEAAASLQGLEAAIVSPIFGLHDDIVGVLYSVRAFRAGATTPLTPLQAHLVQLLAAALGASMVRTSAVRTRVQFEQFFSSELVRELERNPTLLDGRSQEVTLLVSDLRGFTGLSERLGANVSCALIRDLMEKMTDRIVEHGGVIVDYAGDGILAMWNAPVEQADHAARAARAALAMQREMAGLNLRWATVVGGALQLGVGINSGQAQIGNTGSPRRFKYGPHGHSVNLASRVQDATKRLVRPILLTEATRVYLPATLRVESVGKVCLTGVRDEVALFHLVADDAATT